MIVRIFKLCVIGFLSIFISFDLCAQTYQSLFKNQKTEWNIEYHLDIPPITYLAHDVFEAQADSVVEGRSYHSILESEWNSIQLIENDGHSKVWMYDDMSKEEELVFDLTLELGDTFVVKEWIDSERLFFVDSVYILDSRKRIRLSDGNVVYPRSNNSNNSDVYHLEFIEGIGPNISVLYPLYGNWGFGDGCFLVCAKQDDVVSYNEVGVQFSCDSIPVGYESSADLKTSLINFYPNPTHGTVRIEHNFTSNKINLQIFDQQGRLVLEPEFKSIGQGLIEMDATPLQQGIYLCTLFVDEAIVQSDKITILE